MLCIAFFGLPQTLQTVITFERKKRDFFRLIPLSFFHTTSLLLLVVSQEVALFQKRMPRGSTRPRPTSHRLSFKRRAPTASMSRPGYAGSPFSYYASADRTERALIEIASASRLQTAYYRRASMEECRVENSRLTTHIPSLIAPGHVPGRCSLGEPV